jgi:hypothetical protein
MQQVLSHAQYVQADLVVGDYEPQVAERPSVELHINNTFVSYKPRRLHSTFMRSNYPNTMQVQQTIANSEPSVADKRKQRTRHSMASLRAAKTKNASIWAAGIARN